jgi:hypothetical protein
VIAYLRTTASLLICAASVGCVSGVAPYQADAKSTRTLFLPSYQQAGAEPVYSRTRWVHPPEVLPGRESTYTSSSYTNAPSLRPVYHLHLKNATLEQTSRVVGEMARYSSYCSPSLTTQKFSFENLGTIDELARIIEEQAQIKVVVDHDSKEVRFLVRTGLEPTLYSE